MNSFLWDQARDAFHAGDVPLLLFSCKGSQLQLEFVVDNILALKERGIYEPCLLQAFTDTRTNFYNRSDSELSFLFRTANRERLRESGDPIPEQKVFRLYRGVSGVGRWRKPLGFSWTLSLDVACWFAVRFNLARPAVMTAEVRGGAVLAYLNDRHEEEVICRPDAAERLPLSSEELAQGSRRRVEAVKAREAVRLEELKLSRKCPTFSCLKGTSK